MKIQDLVKELKRMCEGRKGTDKITVWDILMLANELERLYAGLE